MSLADLPRYDRLRTYEWNYQNAPEARVWDVPEVPGRWDFCGKPVGSPLGVAAGPLLNGCWCLYYAGLGFDVVTYKTVRSRAWPCYELPNLQPVTCGQLDGNESAVHAASKMEKSWAVSFGMPSQEPDVWRRDVQWTRQQLPAGKLLSVSVVGAVQPNWTIDDLAEDYARCARWATESGADTVEINLSCPNVKTCDGQLYQRPGDAATVVRSVREAIGPVPLIAKIGHITSADDAEELLANVARDVDALATTNSVAARVVDSRGNLLFSGNKRGICGDAIRKASLAQTQVLAKTIARRGDQVRLIGVGGASTAEHVQQYLTAGAHAVHLATAVMIQPDIAIGIREQWPAGKRGP